MSFEAVKSYYNKIAEDYDTSRFENTYGDFIDRQERAYLKKHLAKPRDQKGVILNLGCGTGRFMEFSTIGADFSEEMLAVAKTKFPDKQFLISPAHQLPIEDESVDTIICFHVIMHLSKEYTEEIFKEVHRILKPGGIFIFDYPSAKRRKSINYKAENWHGANAYSKKETSKLVGDRFKMLNTKGILFCPIHRFPKKMRGYLYGFDQLMTSSPLKQYSSYLICKIEKI